MATLVFGLDGANWPLIDPWIEQGKLPTIERLRKQGTWAISKSVLPPVTCPNWKCYASSRSPDAHDVYWWEQVDRETLDVDVPDSTSFTAPELWDYLADDGYDICVVNLPMSYPPQESDGLIVAGGPRSRESDYTYPAELESELEHELGYTVHPENVVTSNEDEAAVEATLDLIQTRFDAADYLLAEKGLDFLHLTVFHLNVLQHYYWNEDPVRRAWEIIDENLARFLDDGHNIFLMSDHGCAEIDTVFHANEWLQDQGYLTMETTAADYLMRFGITQERLAGAVRSVGLESAIRQYIPRRLVERFPDEEGIKRDNKFDKVVAAESDAIASGQGLVYVLHDTSSPAYEQTVEELVTQLSTLKTPQGTPVASTVHRGVDLYPDGEQRYRPDIIFDQGPGLHTSGAVGKETVFDGPGRWRAENIRDGLFLAYGDQVATTGEIDPISILDIAPTVLNSIGEAVPNDFEGTPVLEANTNCDDVTSRPPLMGQQRDPDEDGDEVRDRLADLGYLE